jgi:hypothetical protein
MAEVPISPECIEEVQQVVEVAREPASISGDLLRHWMQSRCPEVQAIAFEGLFDHPEWCDMISEQERSEFFYRFLRDSSLLDQENDYRIRRFDALSYCHSWMERELERGRLENVRRAVNLLGELCSQGSDELRQSVIDVVLEHAFQNENVKQFFERWRTSPQFANVYNEAEELAQKWLKLNWEPEKGTF